MYYKHLFNRLSSLDKIITTGTVMITSQESSFLNNRERQWKSYSDLCIGMHRCLHKTFVTHRHTPCTYIQTHTIYIHIYVHTFTILHMYAYHTCLHHTLIHLHTHTHTSHTQIHHSPAHMQTHTPSTNTPLCTQQIQIYITHIHTLHIHIYHTHVFLRDIF